MALQNIDNPFTKLKFRYLLLRFILLSLLIGFLLGIVQASRSLELNQQDLVLTIYILQFVLLCLWSLKDFQRLRVKLEYVVGAFPKKQNWLQLMGLVLVTIMFSLSASLILFYLLSLVAPSFVEQLLHDVANSPSVDRSNSFYSNLLATFAIVVVAPITEEFIFRGVILQRWATKWGIHAGLLSSSLLFGCLHLNNPIGLSLVGIILGVFYIKTRSIIVPVAFHALNNIFAVSMQLLPNNSLTYTPVDQLQQLRSSWWLGIILMAVSLTFLLPFLRKNWPRKDTAIPYLSNVSKEKGRVRYGNGIMR
ncbi:MAG: CPBP family intramembrane glutamic endopeptidase [Scytonema sp. PMC 1070.18]|nr:CPBP family intramembrane glutamic endopeptidase [Scytonema sp. PMC 1070.18]